MNDKETKTKEKKKIIIEALRRCLEVDVYSNITIQNVANEAGFSKGGLLHYFASKEDMYLELVRTMFEDIAKGEQHILRDIPDPGEKASISSLYGVEKFFLDRNNIHVLLNILLYSFEDDPTREHLRNYFTHQKDFYSALIDEKHKKVPKKRKTDFDSQVQARLLQIMLLSAGFIEAIDPAGIDHDILTSYMISVLKG